MKTANKIKMQLKVVLPYSIEAFVSNASINKIK